MSDEQNPWLSRREAPVELAGGGGVLLRDQETTVVFRRRRGARRPNELAASVAPAGS